MHGWVPVVDGVVPIVHSQKVEPRAHKVARRVGVGRVVRRHNVAAVMLQHIHGHNAPLCKQVGNDKVQEELARILMNQHSQCCAQKVHAAAALGSGIGTEWEHATYNVEQHNLYGKQPCKLLDALNSKRATQSNLKAQKPQVTAQHIACNHRLRVGKLLER